MILCLVDAGNVKLDWIFINSGMGYRSTHADQPNDTFMRGAPSASILYSRRGDTGEPASWPQKQEEE